MTKAYTVRCPFCGAEPGHRCTTPGGHVTDVHKARRTAEVGRATRALIGLLDQARADGAGGAR